MGMMLGGAVACRDCAKSAPEAASAPAIVTRLRVECRKGPRVWMDADTSVNPVRERLWFTERMSSLRCPRCDVSIEPFTLEDGTAIDVCDRCKGAWFDRGELAKVMRTPGDLLDPVPDDVAPARADAPVCPRCAGVCMAHVSYGRPHTVALDRCPYCEGIWTSLTVLPALRQLAAMRAPVKRSRRDEDVAPASLDAVTLDEGAGDDGDVSGHVPLTWRQSLAGVPVALGVVVLLRSTMLGHWLFRGIRTTLHELGHATAAWLSAWKALPVPVGFTFTVPGRHLLLYAIFVAAFGGLVWLGVKRRLYALGVLGVALFALQQVCTWGLTLHRQQELVSWAGCGGEIVLGALLIVLYHHRLPPRLRWSSFRNVALVLGACSLLDAGMFWREANLDHDLIPWDSVMGDCGDMTALRDDHGWTEDMITGRYVKLFSMGMAVVALEWVASVALAWRRRRARTTG